MAQVLVRNLDDEDLDSLRRLAQAHQRSLEGETRFILKDAARRARAMSGYRRRVEAIRAGFGRRTFSDSAKLIREDRDRR